MKKAELAELEVMVTEEVSRRRKLGGFDANAATILFLTEVILDIIRHLENQARHK